MEFESALTVIERAKSVDDLSKVLLDWRDESGVAHLVYHAAHVPACQKPNPLLLLTYDGGWVKRYVEQDYFRIDPVVIAGRNGFLPIRGPAGERALFTITANATDEHWHRWRRTYLQDFHLLAHHLHDRAMRQLTSNLMEALKAGAHRQTTFSPPQPRRKKSINGIRRRESNCSISNKGSRNRLSRGSPKRHRIAL